MIRFNPRPYALAAALSVAPLSACCSAGRAQEPTRDGAASNGDGDGATASELEARVRALLSGYEHVPTAEDWARIGPADEVARILMALVDEPNAKTVFAARATSSLALFPRAEVGRFLQRRVGDEGLAATLRGKAGIALAAAFQDEFADDVAVLFASPDEGLREDGIRAFRLMVSPAAESFMAARAEVEPSARLKAEMVDTKGRISTRRADAQQKGALPDTLTKRPAVKDPGPVRR